MKYFFKRFILVKIENVVKISFHLNFLSNSSKMSEIFDDETWHVVNKYVEENGFLRHQTGAFNDFIDHSVPSIIEMFKKREYSFTKLDEKGDPVTSKYIIEILDSMLTSPRRNGEPLTPNTCLHINCSYTAQLYLTIKITPPAGIPKFIIIIT